MSLVYSVFFKENRAMCVHTYQNGSKIITLFHTFSFLKKTNKLQTPERCYCCSLNRQQESPKLQRWAEKPTEQGSTKTVDISFWWSLDQVQHLLRKCFLSFHNVFLFCNPKSSRELRGSSRPEPDLTFRLGSCVCQPGTPWSRCLRCSHWAAVLTSDTFCFFCRNIGLVTGQSPDVAASSSLTGQVDEGSLIKPWWFLCSRNRISTPIYQRQAPSSQAPSVAAIK